MKRKTSTIPTRIYTYGCLPPVAGADQLEEQFRLAHRYRNKLVEIERRRREGIGRAQREHDALTPLLDAQHMAETTVAEARKLAKRSRSGRGDRQAIAAQRELIEAAVADLAVIRFFVARARYVEKKSDALKAAYDEVSEAAHAETRAVRNADDAPYWGTYLLVEKSAEAWGKSSDPPKFRRYDGQGRIGVQIQKGMGVDEVASQCDARLRIGPATPRVSKKTGRVQTAVRPEYKTVHIRVSSDEKRKPVWASLPVFMHRPLPEDGRIMWAWISRRLVGRRFCYELQLTVEAESFSKPRATKHVARQRTIAVDIGARDLATGETRAALWADTSGASGEVKSQLTRLSSPTSRGSGRRREVPDNDEKTRSILSIMDKEQDACRARLLEHRSTLRRRLPEALVSRLDWGDKVLTPFDLEFLSASGALEYQRTNFAHAWRSPQRFIDLRKSWVRHEQDGVAVAALDHYIERDRHLSDWVSRETRRRINRRSDRYLVFAARIAAEYETIVIAARDYRRACSTPEEAEKSRGTDSRSIMRDAAPGELRQAIRQAAASRGARVVEVPLDGDTAWALDRRVCDRLLASVEVAEPKPVARKGRNHVNSLEPWGKRRLGTDVRVDPLA